MEDEIYYQVRDNRGFPVTTMYDKIPQVVTAAKAWLKQWPNSYRATTQPWGIVRITVHKIGLMEKFEGIK